MRESCLYGSVRSATGTKRPRQIRADRLKSADMLARLGQRRSANAPAGLSPREASMTLTDPADGRAWAVWLLDHEPAA